MFPFFVLVLVTVLLVVVIAVCEAAQRRRTEALLRVAARLGGRYVKAGWLAMDAVVFPVDGRTARLEVFGGAKNAPPFTRVTMPWGAAARLNVREKSILWPLQRWFGARSIEIGRTSFDARFRVEAWPPSLAIRALHGPAAGVLLAYAGLDVSLAAGGDQVELRVTRSLLDDERALFTFAENARTLRRGLREAASQGSAALA
jgi:hypothetical protein